MSQDAEVGDGTTSVVLLAGEFLRESKPYIEEGMHPQTIVKAYREACAVALKKLGAPSPLAHTRNPNPSARATGPRPGPHMYPFRLFPRCKIRPRPRPRPRPRHQSRSLPLPSSRPPSPVTRLDGRAPRRDGPRRPE